MSAFIFSTFYDKPITSLLILRIQQDHLPRMLADIFHSNALYRPKEGRAKSPGVAVDSANFLASMILILEIPI